MAAHTVTVTNCGRVCFGKRKINLSTVFADQNVGVKQVDERIWLVTFMQYDLGFFDDETCRLEPAENTHVSGINRHPCDRITPPEIGRPCWDRTSDQRIKSPLLYRLS